MPEDRSNHEPKIGEIDSPGTEESVDAMVVASVETREHGKVMGPTPTLSDSMTHLKAIGPNEEFAGLWAEFAAAFDGILVGHQPGLRAIGLPQSRRLRVVRARRR